LNLCRDCCIKLVMQRLLYLVGCALVALVYALEFTLHSCQIEDRMS